MSRADSERKGVQQQYGEAMDELGQVRPDLETVIRRYVAAVHAEAAQRRVEAAEARERLVGRAPATPLTGPVPARDPFRVPTSGAAQ